MTGVRVHVGPRPVPGLEAAVLAGGGALSSLAGAEAIVYYGNDDPEELAAMLHPGIRWVQLPHAGVEPWQRAGLITGTPTFSCSSGAYGEAVAEHTLALMLAASRSLHKHARASEWGPKNTRMFVGSTVALIGAGGIGAHLMRMLVPFRCRILAVARQPVVGADRTVAHDDYREVLSQADFVVVAAPYTVQTHHMISTRELGLMKDDAWLVNIARGPLVDTNALAEAVAAGMIGGAALDVTDPEPLPAGHPLWTLPNVLITPHCANPDTEYWAGLTERTRANVSAYNRTGGPFDLTGVVRPELGY